MRNGIGNADITLQRDRGVPQVSFPHDSHLLNHKTCRNWSVQVDGNFPKFRQLDLQICYRILLELREKQRLKLTKLLEPRKAKPSLLKVLPSNVQLLNSLLKDLRRNFAESGEFFLSLGQIVKLLDFVGELALRLDIPPLAVTGVFPAS